MDIFINFLVIPIILFLIIVFTYLLIATILRYIPIYRSAVNTKLGGEFMQIYITSNGAHTDTVLPIHHPWMKNVNWFNPKDFHHREQDQYIGVGWGDKGFYLDIPEWKDLTPMVAIKALFLRAPTLMHLTLQPAPQTSKRVRSLFITKWQFEQLNEHIDNRFKKDKEEQLVKVEGGYTPQDVFYAAKGNYSMFLTCNEWTNRGLKKMKHRTVLWAPFAGAVLEQLEELNDN